MMSQTGSKGSICWFGGARYPRPLDTTSAKKWRLLQEALQRQLFVVGFSAESRPRRFTEFATFYLLPQLSAAILRHLSLFTLGTLLLFWLVIRRRVRVLIAQSPYEGAAAAFVKRVCALLGCRIELIIESHNDFETLLFLQREMRFVGPYRAMMRRAARYAFRHADALRSISQATENQLANHAPGTPIVRFITWTDIDVFIQAPRLTAPSASRDAVFAGVLVPGKGVHILLDAFAQIKAPGANLILVGAAQNADYAAALHEQAARLQIADRVKFVGSLPQHELARHFGAARVMVLPTLSEGLGRVIVEAMACGTPVIASRVGGIPELIRDGENGWLVPPGDVDALAGALHRALGIPSAEIEAVGQRARDFARQFFSSAAYVAGYQQLLETAHDKKAEAAPAGL